MTDVVVNARSLKRFFHEYEFDNKDEKAVREDLLKYIPVACNYYFDRATLIAEPCCIFHPAKMNMKFQLSLRFCAGCEIQLSREYYEQLRYLGVIQKTLLGWDKNRPRPSCRAVSPLTWYDKFCMWLCF